MPSLDVVIVNWNSGLHLRECLASIAKADRNSISLREVIVVDNASTDGSADALECGEVSIRLIRNAENRGFAKACNEGAEAGAADFILFLNPDVRLRGDSLAAAMRFSASPQATRIGIVGIQLRDELGRVARSCARFPTAGMFVGRAVGLNLLCPRAFRDYLMTEWDHSSDRQVDHVIGAFFLVRRQLFKELGGFDERFFVYLEDLDFSLRAKRVGFGCFFLTDSWASHMGGGASENILGRRLAYALQSKILYSYKHFSWPGATLNLLVTFLVEPWARLVWALSRRSLRDAWATIEAYVVLVTRLAGAAWPERSTSP